MQFDDRGGCTATNYELVMRGRSIEPHADPAERGGKKTLPGVRGGGSKNFTRGQSGNFTRGVVIKVNPQETVNKKQVDNNVNVSNKERKRSPLHKGLY